MKKFILNINKYKTLGVILLFVLWQIMSLIWGYDNFILPSPSDTIKYVIYLLRNNYIYKCIFNTLWRMLLGYIFSFILAFVIGVTSGNSKKIEDLLSPVIMCLKSIPTACLVYLFLVIVGARMTPMYIVILVAFPILYESITTGIKNTPEELLEASKIDGSNILKQNISIRIPLSKTYIVSGIASSFGLSLKIEIMAEVITGYTRLGLGSAILAAQRSDPTNMVPVFAYSFIAIVIMLIIEALLKTLINKIK